ncbi:MULTISPECIES: hypothetical protein [unclassified Bradyrhizobium]|uniref:hypothetical protein n=1 Tax=unclassified Bradyrhizobium TaxID=2631580 RepID=UPI001FFBCF15|nr:MULTISPECIES: hypothetical protein [unclassified Bradyrhizobium]MCK1710998.1 hypothetical protein [Bradyrhizobium sp. 143]MCK1730601.1 hypothetical protein [Bradyrhizobium sp. 142]
MPITVDCGTRNGDAGPGCLPNLRLGAVLNLRSIVQPRSTTMIKGIAIALFGLTILSQLDQAFFYGRHSDAALRLVREISRGFGL